LGTVYLPHDGGHGDYKTGKTAKQIMEDLKWTVEVLPNQPVADGIRAARMAFAQMSIDKIKCERLIECLKRYRRSISNTTQEAGNPVHDQFSHGADAYRYTALAAPMMDNQTGMSLPPLKYGRLGIV
jgi:phage terminase large subunit